MKARPKPREASVSFRAAADARGAAPPPRSPRTLTVGAVLASPAGQAGQAPVRRAHVVPEAVVAALAEAGAALAVVVLAADHAVGVAQLGQRALMHVLRPVLTHRQRPLDRYLADEPLLRGRPGACGRAGVGQRL